MYMCSVALGASGFNIERRVTWHLHEKQLYNVQIMLYMGKSPTVIIFPWIWAPLKTTKLKKSWEKKQAWKSSKTSSITWLIRSAWVVFNPAFNSAAALGKLGKLHVYMCYIHPVLMVLQLFNYDWVVMILNNVPSWTTCLQFEHSYKRVFLRSGSL